MLDHVATKHSGDNFSEILIVSCVHRNLYTCQNFSYTKRKFIRNNIVTSCNYYETVTNYLPPYLMLRWGLFATLFFFIARACKTLRKSYRIGFSSVDHPQILPENKSLNRVAISTALVVAEIKKKKEIIYIYIYKEYRQRLPNAFSAHLDLQLTRMNAMTMSRRREHTFTSGYKFNSSKEFPLGSSLESLYPCS